ncbi:MAG: hypothetical protein PHO63_01105 [Bacilli bacterium]|nr:hypothetical protein [Bacilli bacterium]MDD4808463.1 hypothetical protein [Bacilli bacterium]
MIRKHIYITPEMNNKIEIYATKYQLTYSKAVMEIIEEGLNKTIIEGEIDSIKRSLRYLSSKTSYIQKLLEQFYSDLGLELSTDPKTNEHLKKFISKFNKDYFND